VKLTRILAAALLAWAFAAPAAAETQADYARKVSSLLAGMGSEDLKVRKEKQAAFEDICHAAASPGREADRLALCKAVIAKLGPESPAEARVWMLRHLQQIGRAEVVDAVGALLDDKDERIGRCALRALKNNPSPEAAGRLRAALAKADSAEWRIALINALGFRGDAASVAAVSGYLGAGQELLAEAAAAALGKIGGADAAKALMSARKGKSGRLKAAVTEAALVCAEGLLADGRRGAAVTVYEELFAPREEKRTRIAALQGLSAAGAPKAPAHALEFLRADDVALQRGAIGALRRMPADRVAFALADAMGGLPASAKVMALSLIVDRPSRAAFDAVVAATKDAAPTVRIAAAGALCRLGDPRAVGVLASLAAVKGAAQDAARKGLAALAGAGVEEAILEGVAHGAPAVRVALIQALQARATSGATAVLLKAATDRNESVRSAALKAAGALAGEKDLPALVGFLAEARDASTVSAAARAVASICGRAADKDKCVGLLLAALPKASETPKKALLGVLGKLGGRRALAAVREGVASDNKGVRDAAIRALTTWPDLAAAADLLAVAGSGATQTHRVLAVRAYVRMVNRHEKSAVRRLAMLKDAMTVAERDNEKKLVLSAVAGVTHAEALKFLAPYLADESLSAEAKAARQAVKAALAGPAAVWASHRRKDVGRAVDGKKETRWTSGKPMTGGEWFAIDLRSAKKINQVTLDQGKSRDDYPRSYEVYVSNSKTNWGKPVAKGKGSRKGPTRIKLKGRTGRYIKIVQTGSMQGKYWSIHELKIDAK